MKRILNIPIFLLAAAAVFSGCNKDPEPYRLEAPADGMHVRSSADSVVLERIKADEEVLSFSWDDAASRGEDAVLTYYFRLYDLNDKSHASELVKMQTGQRSIGWTSRQLNDLLASWGKPYGEPATVVGEVIAEVTTSRKYQLPELSVTQVKVVGYNPVNLLYLVIPQADGPLRAITMTSSVGDENIYEWKGVLTPCEFKFSMFNTTGLPAYYDAGDGRIEAGDADAGHKYFTCGQESAYEIIVNTKAMTVAIKVIPIYHLFAFVGIGGEETMMELTDQELGSDWFYWEGNLPAGATVRFCRTADGAWPAIIPDADDNQVEVGEGAPLYTTPVSGWYVLSFVGKDEKKLILKNICRPDSGIWMPVGDAFAAVPDWSPGDSYRNGNLFLKPNDKKYEPHIWRLTAEFKLGASNGNREGFKILSSDGWGDPCLHPVVNGINPVDQWTDVELNGNDDKWNPDRDGVWTLEVDLHAMKLRMVK